MESKCFILTIRKGIHYKYNLILHKIESGRRVHEALICTSDISCMECIIKGGFEYNKHNYYHHVINALFDNLFEGF